MNIRQIHPEDCKAIIEAASDWWGRPYSSDMFSKWYIEHFQDTCLLAEEDGKIIGFVMGFLSQSKPNEAYIRIVMVAPSRRGKGVGQALYKEFFKRVGAAGRSIVRCVTAPANKNSIEFHTRMGFIVEPQEQELDGVPVCLDYDGRGGNRVLFKKGIVSSTYEGSL
ncbi:GNAT family N-acetyltransferase [Paenibacillus flagellatus]|uniref:GNAT family N-acetyltransferase n=1 Tax=Paenibacillus flagellatus TaxID=2211139 RepID=A0A2V5JV17_9BACL|nr:GNAT family N-acetyltransferase [Paenibacillus flagellatus]PYI50555.1 GNAT family N-acetyltransferase [Paenibacillus flagellatus]